MPGNRVVIVGAGHAGGRLARTLAAGGGDHRITLIGNESEPPYERPPLSKEVLLGTAVPGDSTILGERACAEAGIELWLGCAVAAIERDRRTVRTTDGRQIGYDALVLATGGRNRRLPAPGGDLDGVHCLRNLDDARRLLRALEGGGPLVVIGGGFIGLEVAAAARRRGLEVTVVERAPRTLSRAVPEALAAEIEAEHRRRGVGFRLGAATVAILGSAAGRATGVALSGGEVLPCGLVLVAVGLEPDTGLATACGLTVDDGIVVDAGLRTDDPAVFAIGDAARFNSPLYDRPIRLESWRNAEDHAAVVAARLRGEAANCTSAPWVWSDQYDSTLTLAGLPDFGVEAVTRPGSRGGPPITLYLDAAGRLVGAGAFGPKGAAFRDMRIAQMLIERRATPAPSLLADGERPLKVLLAA
jgi:3-phenylpropionate/trans-cinnamate dioxygenase ferredoxin reductase subunit